LPLPVFGFNSVKPLMVLSVTKEVDKDSSRYLPCIVSSLFILVSYIVSLNLACVHMQANTSILAVSELLVVKDSLASGGQSRPCARLVLMERQRIAW
jgi:hypothetical protein